MSASANGESQAGARQGRAGHRWYALAVMWVIYACHSMDRALPNILVEPVKNEFGLSDTQVGLFTGLAYGVAFSLAVLPAGWIADRVSRRNFLALAVVVWSALTALGGVTRSFGQLLLARIGVGIGESAGAPLVLPMLSDLFPPNKRSLALGILYMAVPAGAVLASAIGAHIAQDYGWRHAFFVAGVPGVLIAVLLFLTVREPKRGGLDAVPETPPAAEPKPRLLDNFLHFYRNPGLAALLFGAVIIGLLNIVMGAWMSSFFIRVHHLDLATTGLVLGLGAGLCGAFSPLLNGWLADRLSQRNRLWSLRLSAIGALLSLAFTQLQLFTPSVTVAIVAFILADFTRTGYTPPLYAVLMTQTPARIRASVMSIVQLTTNLAGFGLGPVLTGKLSDYFGGGVGIKYALASVSVLFVVAALLLLLSGRLLFGRDGKAGAAGG
ncbi:MAG: MFS transporter [Dehalococcoidia bacterium]|nr:MFS transporter [Dehalococcoidia bacterium]